MRGIKGKRSVLSLFLFRGIHISLARSLCKYSLHTILSWPMIIKWAVLFLNTIMLPWAHPPCHAFNTLMLNLYSKTYTIPFLHYKPHPSPHTNKLSCFYCATDARSYMVFHQIYTQLRTLSNFVLLKAHEIWPCLIFTMSFKRDGAASS